jgi:hypothetical protein
LLLYVHGTLREVPSDHFKDRATNPFAQLRAKRRVDPGTPTLPRLLAIDQVDAVARCLIVTQERLQRPLLASSARWRHIDSKSRCATALPGHGARGRTGEMLTLSRWRHARPAMVSCESSRERALPKLLSRLQAAHIASSIGGTACYRTVAVSAEVLVATKAEHFAFSFACVA